jgi:hypothetical protein
MSTDLCTTEYRYGLNVTVIDSITLKPPASATLIATSGAFQDSVGPMQPVPQHANDSTILILSTAGERAGTYDITVRSPGYRDWTQRGIRVTANACHVNPIFVTARLVANSK